MQFLPHYSVFSDHNYVEHIETYYVIYMSTLFIGMIGDEANGWGTSHLETHTIMSIFNDMS